MESPYPGQLVVSPFRKFLLELSEHLTKENVDKLKFLVPDLIPPAKAETVHNGQQFLTVLEQANRLDTEYLCELFESIGRKNLVDCIRKGNIEDEVQVYRPHQEGLQALGYSVRIVGGKHYSTLLGEYVELKTGTNFKLHVSNNNPKGCHLDITMHDDIYIGGWVLKPHEDVHIERPVDKPLKFIFYKVDSAPQDCGIQGKCEANGVIKCEFTPERDDVEDRVDDFSLDREKCKDDYSNARVVSGASKLKMSKNTYPGIETDASTAIEPSEEDFTQEPLAARLLRELSEPFQLPELDKTDLLLEQLDPFGDGDDILKNVNSDNTIIIDKAAGSPEDSQTDDDSDEEKNNTEMNYGRKPPTRPITTVPSVSDPFHFTSILNHVHDKATEVAAGKTRSFTGENGGEDAKLAASLKKGAQKRNRYRCTNSRIPASPHPNKGHSYRTAATKDDWTEGAATLKGFSAQLFDQSPPLRVDDSLKVVLQLRLVASGNDDLGPEPPHSLRPPPPKSKRERTN